VIYFSAEPFLGSLLAVSAAIGVPSFVFVQWVAPFVSEFPEKVSAFYWAKTIQKAPMALMNMVSSNINQWTLLAAMLPIVFSWSRGEPSAIPFDETQELEILMTIGQSLVGMIFLVNMKLVWWEASALFGLWFIQFAFSPVHNAEGLLGFLANNIHWYVTVVYLVWAGVGLLGFLFRPKTALAFRLFGKMWRTYVRPRAAA
jgi:cation:H+ antiporter